MFWQESVLEAYPIWAAIVSHRLSMGLDPRTRACDRPIVYRWDGHLVARSSGTAELLPGTLDLLILRALRTETMHGYGIAERLREVSHDVLQVGESSLYPALQRLLLDGYVRAEWGTSENNRRARFYTLTAAGRKQLVSEQDEFERMVGAIHAVLRFA